MQGDDDVFHRVQHHGPPSTPPGTEVQLLIYGEYGNRFSWLQNDLDL